MSKRLLLLIQMFIFASFILVSMSCQRINGPIDPGKQYKLAEAYYSGEEGIVRNYEKAYFWALIASAQGEDAGYIMESIEDEYLSKRRIIEIQNKAMKWHSSNKKGRS
ncbi:MAG TPA: SEL1-like repeat protein [Candidatus Cloacimonadota bacterium]|nr:SEL1-like repeat protein [Candidatus Cloacimonadota bacterium]